MSMEMQQGTAFETGSGWQLLAACSYTWSLKEQQYLSKNILQENQTNSERAVSGVRCA